MVSTIFLGISSLLHFVHSSTMGSQYSDLRSCDRECRGTWGTWNHWDECKGGRCHVIKGRQIRENICFVEVPPSRGDKWDDPKKEEKWSPACRETEHQECVAEKTCLGTWSAWEEWTKCSLASNAECARSRRRFCYNENKMRLPGRNCFGGLEGDTEKEMCNSTCPISMAYSERTTATADNDHSKKALLPEESVDTRKAKKGLSHNTVLIISVAIGSLVFGAVFVLVLLNLVRKSQRRDGNRSSGVDRWKRVGSTNTSSTGYSTSYMAASDILSPRSLGFEARSPSSLTTGSGSSTNASHFFGRCDSRSPLAAKTSELPGQLTMSHQSEGRPRRSRLLQENVYWEITETTSLSSDEDVDELATHERSTHSNPGEVVQNVLYDIRA